MTTHPIFHLLLATFGNPTTELHKSKDPQIRRRKTIHLRSILLRSSRMVHSILCRQGEQDDESDSEKEPQIRCLFWNYGIELRNPGDREAREKERGHETESGERHGESARALEREGDRGMPVQR